MTFFDWAKTPFFIEPKRHFCYWTKTPSSQNATACAAVRHFVDQFDKLKSDQAQLEDALTSFGGQWDWLVAPQQVLYQFIYIVICLSIYQSIYLSLGGQWDWLVAPQQVLYQFIYIVICLSIYLSIYLSLGGQWDWLVAPQQVLYQSIYIVNYLSIYLSWGTVELAGGSTMV